MNYYEHHMGDYLKATAHLSALEDCFYRRALDWYYSNEKPLPSDEAQVARLLRAQGVSERKAVKDVLSEFFALTNDGWRNKRADSEIADFHVRLEKNRENGKKGGRPRKPKQNPKITDGFISANPNESETKGHQSPDSSNQSSSLRSEEKRAPRSVSVSAEQLASEHGVDKQVAADWLTVRKAKKSPLTQTALDNLITEFATAGLSTADGVRMCVERGWVGFKPDWLKNGVSHETATNHRRRLTPADVCRLENEQHAARREGRVYNA